MVEVAVQRLDPALPLSRAGGDVGRAGLDLFARSEVTLQPGGGRALIPTGIAVAIPDGYAGFILPQDDLATTSGVSVLNRPGLIDSGYRSEVGVVLINSDPFTARVIRRGDLVARLVIAPVERMRVVEGGARGTTNE